MSINGRFLTGLDRTADIFQQYGPWAVIAGASEGLGAAYADQLAQHGLNMVLVARREAVLSSLARRLEEKYRIHVRIITADLSFPETAIDIIQQTKDLEIGLLVYNAAVSLVGPFLQHSAEDHLKEIQTNVRTPMVLAHHFAGPMFARKRGGIILMSSLSAFQGSAFISNYAATKAYNILLAEGLWEEWRQVGIDVLACVAGATSTPNYMASAPKNTGRFSDATLSPETVVRETLDALGRQPFVIPGRANRIASFLMRHILPRKLAIQIMGNILRKMYV